MSPVPAHRTRDLGGVSTPAGGAAFWQALLQGLASAFGERRCLCCAAVFRPGREKAAPALLCPDCLKALPARRLGHCPLCGEIAAWPELPLAPCAHCLASPPPWQDFAFHGIHESLLRQLLIRLKFGDQPQLGRALGTLLAEHPLLAGFGADAVTPVPLHAGRLSRRGYNQALELARPLAERLGLPLRPQLLTRVRATAPQTGAERAARVLHIRNAFAAHPQAKGRRILLLDDTLTTGATMAEAARCLLEAGAARVSAVAVSRTARHFVRL